MLNSNSTNAHSNTPARIANLALVNSENRLAVRFGIFLNDFSKSPL